MIEPPKQPEFKSTLPAHLLKGLTERDKWLCEQTDLARQMSEHQVRQNDFVITTLKAGEDRFNKIETKQNNQESKLNDLEPLRHMVKSRGRIFGTITTLLIFPIAVLILFEKVKTFFGIK